MKVTGKSVNVAAKDCTIYAKICNCNNFAKFLPDQIKDWQSTEDYCQFSIPGIAELKITISEKQEFSKVMYAASNDKNIPINIRIFLNGHDDTTDVSAEIEADIPIFLTGMVQKPLQNLVDIIGEKIKTEIE